LNLVIERLVEADSGTVDNLVRAAYKSERSYARDLKQYLQLQPACSFVAKTDGSVVGFGGVIIYGPFAYIGLMATHPDMQGQGIGRQMLNEIIAFTEAHNCPTIFLDARAAGVHLYQSLGFVDIDLTIVFGLEGTGPRIRDHRYKIAPARPVEFSELLTFDSLAFGANRGPLLRYYYDESPKHFLVARDSSGKIDGYAVVQPMTIGPWVVSSPIVAKELLSRAIEFPFEGGPQVMVSNSNTEALDLLVEFGFKMQRSVRHMRRGRSIVRGRATAIYGQATLGFG
jgi:GNAT superfamily N-acetyltransferase